MIKDREVDLHSGYEPEPAVVIQLEMAQSTWSLRVFCWHYDLILDRFPPEDPRWEAWARDYFFDLAYCDAPWELDDVKGALSLISDVDPSTLPTRQAMEMYTEFAALLKAAALEGGTVTIWTD